MVLVPIVLLVALTMGAVRSFGSAQVGGGYVSPECALEHDSIWRAGSDNSPDNTTVTLRLSGAGTKGITLAPQDVIFMMDHSGSLGTNDPQVLRILGAHSYIDSMIAPYDRAALIKFDNNAELVNGNHLTSNYPQVHANLEALARSTPQGLTDFQGAFALLLSELATFAEPTNQKVAVLFTDGFPDPPERNVTPTQMDELSSLGVKVFCIGLGDTVDEGMLRYVSGRTGGTYYNARTPEDLVEIYLEISDQFYDQTAGTGIQVRLELTSDMSYIEGSSSLTWNLNVNTSGERTVLEWTAGDMMLRENWTVSFRVFAIDGEGRTRVTSERSSLSYTDWRGNNITADLPDLYLTVISSLPPPLPPPPPAPLPAAPAPIPPPPSVPVIAPSVNVAPVITATPNVTPVMIGQTAAVPVEYMLAGLAALGIASRTKLKKKIAEKQRVSVGS